MKQTTCSFKAVFNPKMMGLIAIENATIGMPLSSIVLFSSISSIVAPLGQSNYAVANAMMNSWANGHNLQVNTMLCVATDLTT